MLLGNSLTPSAIIVFSPWASMGTVHGGGEGRSSFSEEKEPKRLL
jgi:hypothetical protein